MQLSQVTSVLSSTGRPAIPLLAPLQTDLALDSQSTIAFLKPHILSPLAENPLERGSGIRSFEPFAETRVRSWRLTSSGKLLLDPFTYD